jgi:8-oxo-dGTP diphosphatase
MAAGEQEAHGDRYSLIPRTAIFLRDGDAFLLLKGSSSKRIWPDRYNGVGGHVDRGEDILTAALREVREETGLEASLWLCGTVVVDSGAVRTICLQRVQSLGSFRISEGGRMDRFDRIRLPPCRRASACRPDP